MPYMIETWDKPDHGALRLDLRPAHLDYLERHKALLLACGAKLDESKRAHSDRSLTCLLGEGEEENQYFNTVTEEKPELV